MNILFWNLHRNRITGYVRDCLLENRVDVALFAEHDGLDREALERETEYRFILGLEDMFAEKEGIIKNAFFYPQGTVHALQAPPVVGGS